MKRVALVIAFALAGCGPTVGDPCTTSVDCGGALCINLDYAKGGYCSAACDDKTGCPTGTTCLKHALGQGSNACFRLCSRQAECRNGYACRSVEGSPSVCIGPQGF